MCYHFDQLRSMQFVDIVRDRRVLKKGEATLFMLYKQRIAQYFHQHRIISIITGHFVVITILTMAVFSNSLGKSLTSAFAQTSCPTGDQTYVVRDGNTLSDIATNHGTTWQELAQHNSIANPSWIYPGQTICLPATHAASAQSTPASPKSIIHEVFGSDAPSATHIAMCESTLNPYAVNSIPIGGSHAKGLFQILYPSTWSTTSQSGMSPFDARANAIAAHEIFVRDGHSWREWACRP
jgi:LysM repeat protein